MPEGCFVGFVAGTKLRHCMIHVGKGIVAGNKNACVFSTATDGWETLDIKDFFTSPGNSQTKLIYKAVNMQLLT